MRIRNLLTLACLFVLSACQSPPDETTPAPATTAPADRPVESRPDVSATAFPESPADELARLDAAIANTPVDPILYMRRAQALMKLRQYDEGYAAAHDAMAKFEAAGNDLIWILLESIERDSYRIDVHFNMGPRERHPPESGIIRPLSFRVWKAGDKVELLDMLDFEHALMNSEPITAAFGKTSRRGHTNYGMIDPNATYAEIRSEAVALIERLHPE